MVRTNKKLNRKPKKRRVDHELDISSINDPSSSQQFRPLATSTMIEMPTDEHAGGTFVIPNISEAFLNQNHEITTYMISLSRIQLSII